MRMYQSDEQLIKMLLNRLERISADSYWAHRASGMRGSLLNALELGQQGQTINRDSLESLIKISFSILERAAAGAANENSHKG